jgi:DNA-binding NarL/FixJ family response regulator
VRVILADDAVVLREGLARLLSELGFDIVGQVADGPALLEAVERHRPDVAIVDMRMPPSQTDEGLRAAEDIRRRHPAVGVLLLSQYAAPKRALRLIGRNARGAGYLLKDRVSDVDEFAAAVRRVGSGGIAIDPAVVSRLVEQTRAIDAIGTLTEREGEILRLVAEGRSNRAIASALFLGLKTVETHIAGIFTKLDLPPAADDHRRVLAVLTYLQSAN